MEPELLQLHLTETYRDSQQRHFSAEGEGNMTFIFDEGDFGSQIWGWPDDIRITITAAMNKHQVFECLECGTLTTDQSKHELRYHR